MTVHVLHAGNGYEYLTRQVASGDEPRRGLSLSEYYNAHGNPPGRWVGTGTAAMQIAGKVDAIQMRNLFGTGSHPNDEAQMLGRPFLRRREWEEDPYLVGMEQAFAAFAEAHDRAPEAGAERAQIRRQVATAMVRRELDGAEPSEPEVSRYLALRGLGDREGVSGFDLVFTPPKSVSVLWGLADDHVREQISRAHAHAWKDTLAWIEQEAAVTRTGHGGLKQINTRGLTAAAFDHLDSRAGDPNLHTHVAVSSKVMGDDGRWRSLDARVLFSLNVAASERYNALVEEQLVERLGVQFVAVARPGVRVPVREIDGVGSDLVELFSQRRRAITASYDELVADYRANHGHEPTRAEQYRLAQTATLATRTAKEPGRPLHERVVDWRARAVTALGSDRSLQERLSRVLNRPRNAPREFDQQLAVEQTTARVLELLGRRRATWNEFHVRAEATRVVRELPAVQQGWWPVADAAQAVTAACLKKSVQLTTPEATPTPSALARTDGTSVYVPHGTTKYTSTQVLDAERKLLTAAQTRAGFIVAASVFESAVADVQIDSRRRLDASQLEMARLFACSHEQLAVGIGPAGAGKTTAMAAFAAAVRDAGGRVVAVGPSAVAARVLGDELGVAAETLHKLIDQHERGAAVPEHLRVDERTVLLVDEAGMAGTLELQQVLHLAQRAGASVRLLGDPAQLGAVGAGGALRMIANTVGAAELREVHRFTTPGEDMAGLLIRDGRTAGLDFYINHGRVHTGSRESALEDLHADWAQDIAAGDNSIMIAATNEDVAYLNERARLRRVTDQQVAPDGVTLDDGTTAGVGDVVVTRHNDRMLRHGSTDYVKNGDLWTVTGVRADGTLHLQHRAHRTRTVLPADYVKEHVQLGYATTVHRCQGMTVEVARMLVDASMSREHLYTGITRGRRINHLYVVNTELLDVSLHHPAGADTSARDVLETVLTRSAADDGAIATAIYEAEASASLATLVPAYEDAYASALDPDAVARMSDVVRAAYPLGQADRILRDDAWPYLAGLLYCHQRSGGDLLATIGARVEGLDGARSPAALLACELDEPGAAGNAHGLPAWITPPPLDDVELVGEASSAGGAAAMSGTEDKAVAAWLRDRAQRIGDRLDELTRRVAERPPVWAAALPTAPPADTPERVLWDHHVRQIVAYRDRYAVDADSPLGRAVAPESPMGRARTTARQGLEALGATDTAPSGGERARLLQNEREHLLEQAEDLMDDLSARPLDLLDPMHQHLAGPVQDLGPGIL